MAPNVPRCLNSATRFTKRQAEQPGNEQFLSWLQRNFTPETFNSSRFYRLPAELVLLEIIPRRLPSGDYLAAELARDLKRVARVPHGYKGTRADLDVCELIFRNPGGVKLPQRFIGREIEVRIGNRSIVSSLNWVSLNFADGDDGDIRRVLGMLAEVEKPGGRYSAWKREKQVSRVGLGPFETQPTESCYVA